jgi:hypothetical protein
MVGTTNVEEALRTWRPAMARKEAVPAYVILKDTELAAIAGRDPRTLAELASCRGIGQIRLERWGDEILAVLDAGPLEIEGTLRPPSSPDVADRERRAGRLPCGMLGTNPQHTPRRRLQIALRHARPIFPRGLHHTPRSLPRRSPRSESAIFVANWSWGGQELAQRLSLSS